MLFENTWNDIANSSTYVIKVWRESLFNKAWQSWFCAKSNSNQNLTYQFDGTLRMEVTWSQEHEQKDFVVIKIEITLLAQESSQLSNRFGKFLRRFTQFTFGDFTRIFVYRTKVQVNTSYSHDSLWFWLHWLKTENILLLKLNDSMPVSEDYINQQRLRWPQRWMPTVAQVQSQPAQFKFPRQTQLDLLHEALLSFCFAHNAHNANEFIESSIHYLNWFIRIVNFFWFGTFLLLCLLPFALLTRNRPVLNVELIAIQFDIAFVRSNKHAFSLSFFELIPILWRFQRQNKIRRKLTYWQNGFKLLNKLQWKRALNSSLFKNVSQKLRLNNGMATPANQAQQSTESNFPADSQLSHSITELHQEKITTNCEKQQHWNP